MPEGHTLHRLAHDLDRAFAGRLVRVGSPQGRFEDAARLLDGQSLESAESWGKHLFIAFPGERYVHVHLGLYGAFDVHHDLGDTGEVPAPVGQVRLRLVTADAGPTAYADLRGATTCELVTREQRDAVLARIGPDPLRLDQDPARAWERIRRSKGPVGGLLMDQSVLAGVGNVYRAELLFRHRIHPLRPGSTLRVGQWRAMWDDLVELMGEGVRTGRIDTVRPEHTPEAMGRPPRKDDHGGEVYVYRRTGQPCLVCGASVRTAVLQARNVFWCPRCQPTFRSRAVPC
ncbi:Fpg/Nei family DNA glycosylase [Nocardioides sp. cx-169]|uniref:Fpg/Nei family DNA glycosylase n=1 Tax=Nocardioides sp. cx-169 TaxID=2899080 RepID=UPI001E54176A|nr:DNA-formamidopyrimidine glycosylase family protein [Nocardioides sp. cx-169]MCD4535863.1 Fpg/Nei family DNA glycosylase [Nocardioides sp. cx-169]